MSLATLDIDIDTNAESITPISEEQAVSPEVQLQRAISAVFPSKQRWLFFHRLLICSSFIGPSVFTISWLYILYISPYSMDGASVSHVWATSASSDYTMCLLCTIISCILLIILVLARNMQCQVIFVDSDIGKEWGVIWRFLNLFSMFLSIIGIVNLVLLIVFDSVNYPQLHLIFAALMVGGIGFYELIHAAITFRHRLHQYRQHSKCRKSIYFVDGVFFCFISLAMVFSFLMYMKAVSEVGVDAEAAAMTSGYTGEWMLFLCMVWYFIMLSLTLHLDSTEDEIKLFATYSYYIMLMPSRKVKVLMDTELIVQTKRNKEENRVELANKTPMSELEPERNISLSHEKQEQHVVEIQTEINRFDSTAL